MLIMQTIIIFFFCSLVNVMLSTSKSILTVKGGKGTATIANAVTYGFYAVVVKQLATLDLSTTVVVTIVTNVIGVYSSMWILEKTKKECLWKISATLKDTTIVEKLKPFAIDCLVNEVVYNNKRYYCIDIFSKGKRDSEIIKEILHGYDVKYNITEIVKKL